MKVIDKMADQYTYDVTQDPEDINTFEAYLAGFDAARDMIAKKLDQFAVTQAPGGAIFIQEASQSDNTKMTLGDLIRQVGEDEVAE